MAPCIDLLCCVALPAVINVFGPNTYLSARRPLNVRTHLDRQISSSRAIPTTIKIHHDSPRYLVSPLALMLDLVIFWLLLLLFKTTIPSVTLLVNGSRTFGNGCFSHLWQSKRKGNGNSIVYTRKAKWCQPVSKFPRGATVKRNTLYISICMWMYVQYGCWCWCI